MNILFASNSYFGEIVLKEMIHTGTKPGALVTSPDKKHGRGLKEKPLAIKEFAKKQEIPVKEVSNKAGFHRIIEEERPDIAVVAGFGLIIPPPTLQLTRFINIHPSLLPKYRGPTPVQSAIINGEKKSGVTVVLMNEKIDQGPIICQKEIPFQIPDGTRGQGKITYREAEKMLAKEGGALLSQKLPFICQNEFTTVPQREKEATYTSFFSKKDGIINWEEPAETIERKIRALNPGPGTYTKLHGKRIKILEAEAQEQTKAGPFGDPGKIYLGTNHTIGVQTGKGFLLVKKMQMEGKKPTSSKDFLQGNMELIGSFFG